MSDIKEKISSVFQPLLDFIYPKICLISNERISENNSNDFVCDCILDKIEIIKPESFPLHRAKINSDFFFTRFAFRTDNEIQTLIHYLKYKGFYKIGIFLGELTGKALLKKYENKLDNYNYLLPVPLFNSKERERGYNQSFYICKGISNVTKLKIADNYVFRKRNTKSQTKLKYEERINNVRDAFTVETKNLPADAKGFLVVDDVMTTGSTVKEIIRILKAETNFKIGAVISCLARD